MTKSSQIFDDIAQMASGATGGFMEIKREIEQMVGAQAEKILHNMHLVTREEFDAVKEMAANARAENEKLHDKINELEAEINNVLSSKN